MSIFPQVLLLGNGINIAYGGASWNELLKRITKNKDLLKLDLKSPMPLRAVLLTGSHIKGAMKTEKEHLMGRIDNKQQRAYYRSLLAAGFDHILTTNYSYELEIASADKAEIKESALKKMLSHTEIAKAAEPKYMLHTYYDCTFDGHQNRIWHIHGEARKPDSMVLGHYYYGSLFSKIKEYLDKKRDYYSKDQKEGKTTPINSWIDAFILGDVYVLGFGYDLSEFDLWWLLERKSREKAETGKLFYFAPSSEEFDEKTELLKVYEDTVQHIDCGIAIPKNATKEEKNELYRKFYEAAQLRIREMMEEKERSDVEICNGMSQLR